MSGLNGKIAGALVVPGEPFHVDVGELRVLCKPLNAPARAQLMIAGGVHHVPEGGEVAITPNVLALACQLGITGWRWIEPRAWGGDDCAAPPPEFDPLTDGLPPFPGAAAVLEHLDDRAFLEVGEAIVARAFVSPEQAGN